MPMDPPVSDGRQTGSDSGLGSCCSDTATTTELYLSSDLDLQDASGGIAYNSPASGTLEATTTTTTTTTATTCETAQPPAPARGRQLPHSRHTPDLTAATVGGTSSTLASTSMNASAPDSYFSNKHSNWPSPPLGPGDLDSIAHYELSAASHPNSAYPDTPTPSVTWQSSSTASLYHPSPSSGDLYHHDPNTSLAVCTPPTPLHMLSSDSCPSMTPAFGGQMYSPVDAADISMQQAQLSFGMNNNTILHHGGDDMGSAGMAHDGYMTHPFGMPATPESFSTAPKSDEPYAKLIYRALMSKPGRRMTLQEIYQWFRDNTTKADGDKDKKGGWQNSIRHNLSMNRAFVKPDPKDEGVDSKRSNVWVLEDWAVIEGVKSTTHYRHNTAKRPTIRCSSQQRDGHHYRPGPYSALRSQSGRRGGCATRNARLREQLSHQSLGTDMPAQYTMMFGHPISPPRSVVLSSHHLPDGLMGTGTMPQGTPVSYGYSNPGFDPDPADMYLSDPSMGHYVAVGGELGSLQHRFNAGPTATAAAAATSAPAVYFGTQIGCRGTGEAANQYNNGRQNHADYGLQSQVGAATTDADSLCHWQGGM